MHRFQVIVPASQIFIPGLTVFLKSFYHYHEGKDIGVTLLNYDLPDDYVRQWPFERVIQLRTDRGPGLVCKLESYRIAADQDRVTMLADADSFFLASMLPWFELAACGYIVGSANGQNILFKEDYEKLTGIEGIAGKFAYRTIAAPIILDPRKHGQVFTDAVAQWWKIGENHATSIWMLMNAMMAMHGKQEDIVLIPAQQCTNLHQKMLKPGTRVRRHEGRLMTEDGLQVLMCHDKWWRDTFLEGLMRMGEKFCKGDARCLSAWRGSRDLIKQEFDRWR
jgi:hypothetical protein